MKFDVRPAPHAPPRVGVPLTMRRVLYALTPAAVAHVWYFGAGLMINFAIAATFALLAEATVLRLRGRGTRGALRDGSALVSAALLSFAIPPLTPWWIPAVGATAAIVVAKQLYGGLGKNLFNPAMVGFVLLLISFPVEMTQWIPPRMGDIDYEYLTFFAHLNYSLTGRLPVEITLDALTRATPLDVVKEGLRAAVSFNEVRARSLFGSMAGRGFEWINNFIAIGGLYLIYTNTIRWHIPVALLAGLLVPAGIFFALDPGQYAPPWFHLFAGATVLGAFFIATDPVSAAAGVLGRLIFGAGIGLLTFAIRTWGGYPDGIAFSVLLMNAAVPLIDRYTRPTVHGHG